MWGRKNVQLFLFLFYRIIFFFLCFSLKWLKHVLEFDRFVCNINTNENKNMRVYVLKMFNFSGFWSRHEISHRYRNCCWWAFNLVLIFLIIFPPCFQSKHLQHTSVIQLLIATHTYNSFSLFFSSAIFSRYFSNLIKSYTECMSAELFQLM